ncbi:MAG: fasciclin domain-containing protein [Chitinophagaceae bacterium]|nr:MAG: fasciclin domain-containing protein [Chitinophagaceae bacterium]
MRKPIFAFATAFIFSTLMVSCSDSGTTTTNSTDSSKTMSNTGTNNADSMNNMSNTNTTSEQGVMVGGAMMVPSKNIVENAAGSADHTTLVAAVKAAGLDATLSGAGPFTVFAPTNEAFNKLPAGTVDNLVKPENKEKLTNILTFHVVPGALKAADLKDGQKLKTVQGEELTVTMKDGKVMINGATVTIPDVVSSNGVTHVIDAVLMPKK